MSIDACACIAGAYTDANAVKSRAMALVPGRAQFSTLANRGVRSYISTAQFNSAMGPPGGAGATTFDRDMAQYIDGGPHQFDLGTNGFTAVAVVMFTSMRRYERIFDMGKGMNNDNILLSRFDTSNRILFSIRDGNSECRIESTIDVIVLNTWSTIVATYDHNDRSLKMRIDNTIVTPVICETALSNRDVANTLVGKSNWPNDLFSGRMAGLYAVDALLTEPEIAEVVSRMNAGEDVLQPCSSCAANTFKPNLGNDTCMTCPENSVTDTVGSTLVTDCKCPDGYQGADGGECLPCAPGTFKLGLGSTCSDCPAGTYGMQSDAPCVDCPHGKYNLVPGADSSDLCLSCAPGKFHDGK